MTVPLDALQLRCRGDGPAVAVLESSVVVPFHAKGIEQTLDEAVLLDVAEV